MASERSKMLAGELYDPLDAELAAARARARRLTRTLNETEPEDTEKRQQILHELLAGCGRDTWIEPPFYCDYGSNITIGDRVYFNFNCVVLDVAEVRIGSYAIFGPNVQLYTATHPLSAKQRRTGLENAKPIEIGNDVWIGGGAIVCPGVKIGAGSIIGAGSVVTRDIPPGVLAAGNPCRVIRELGSE